jgi:WD40 repeat protein
MCCDASSDGLYYVTGENGFDSDGCAVQLWDARMGKALAALSSHSQCVYDVQFAPPSNESKSMRYVTLSSYNSMVG